MGYVKSHLHHICCELLKNSVRAVVELHSGEKGEEHRKKMGMNSSDHKDGLPPVVVVISGGDEDVTIKISDQGVGIPSSELRKIWSYHFSTAQGFHEKKPSLTKGSDVSHPNREPLRDDDDELLFPPDVHNFRENFYGLGYGLPVCRVFARYFGGDLSVVSTESIGTDV